ncbi:putative Ubiquitin-like domain-containing protein [Helianthus annuus]|nr:putative Ubiquitin-like domain-containing protein [Helianthus annuus]KAJ0793699.1 putative Ubiquitin-like domain-containing protein [Helianthus annuus]KAJ0958285.1 putative Ubiquitin domain-containing protein [Helianthus annuus]
MASLRKPNGDGVDYFEAEENDYGVINVLVDGSVFVSRLISWPIYFNDVMFVCLIVITATGKTISLQVKGLDTISNIKLKIEAQEDIPCRQQKLIFDEKLLQDNDILGNLCIEKESTLKLMRNSKGFMNIFIKTPHCGPWPTPPLSLEVEPSDTIGSVKAKMKYVVDVLIFNEIILNDTDTLADLNIINGSTLTSMVKYVISMKIFVSFNSRKTITLLVNSTDTITKVKSRIERLEGVPVNEQVLIFNNVVLRDSGTLSDFHINRKSTLTFMLRSRKSTKSKEPMKIFFKTLTGETVTKIIKPSDTVNRIKAIIQDEVQIPHHEQELIFNEMVLDNNDTLSSYNINNNSTLTVMRVSG